MSQNSKMETSLRVGRRSNNWCSGAVWTARSHVPSTFPCLEKWNVHFRIRQNFPWKAVCETVLGPGFSVRIGCKTSYFITWAPQGCVLCPLFFSHYWPTTVQPHTACNHIRFAFRGEGGTVLHLVQRQKNRRSFLHPSLSTFESVLICCITVWHGHYTVGERKRLQGVSVDSGEDHHRTCSLHGENILPAWCPKSL